MADFTEILCPLCSASTFRVVYPGKFPADLSPEFLSTIYRSSSDQTLFEQVVRCTRCRLVYLNPRLNPDLIIESYAQGEDQAFVEQDAMRIRTFTEALRKLEREYGLNLSSETKVLDVGCAGGAFVRAARDLELSVIGVEPSKWLSSYARTTYHLDVRTGTLAMQNFPAASFDLVTLWDVIEHLSDPGAELDRIHKLLKPTGLLVVNYPDFGSAPAQLLGKKWPFLLSVHLIYYTRYTIRKQLRKCGFQVLDIRRHWQTLELGYVLRRAAVYFSFFRFIGAFVEKIGLGHLPIKYWIGQTRVVARKKPEAFSATQAVIFDMDGVLFESSDCHERGYKHALALRGITNFSYAAIAGMRTDEAIRKILLDHGKEATDEEVKQLVTEKRAQSLTLLRQYGVVAAGSKELIAVLRKKYRLALATSASRETLALFLEKCGYADAFEVVLEGSMVPQAKPAPDIYELSLKKLGLTASQCVVVEDSASGIIAAQAAHIPVIGLMSDATREKIKSLRPTAMVEHLSQIQQIL